MPFFSTSANLIVSFGCAQMAPARSSPTLPLTTSNAAVNSMSRMWYPPRFTCMSPGTNWSSSAFLKYSTPWSSELAQLPTPMMATRTLPLDSDIGASELLSDVEDALENRDPGGRGEHDDRPLETAPGSEDEPRGDDDHALRAGPEPDVAAQAE